MNIQLQKIIPFRHIIDIAMQTKSRLGLRIIRTSFGRRLLSKRHPELKEFDNTYKPSRSRSLTGDTKKIFLDKAQYDLNIFFKTATKFALPQSLDPKVSIVLVLYNQAPLTFMCLRSIAAIRSIQIEVIIVDNNSSDATEQLLRTLSNVRIVRNSENRGFVKAVNQGAKISKGEHILLLNNDATLQPGALDVAVRTLENTENAGAVGGKIVLLDGKLQEAGSIIWNDGSCLGYGRNDNPESPEYMFRRDVNYCSGAFLLFPKSLYDELGGLDECYAPAYYEETDFCLRLQKKGYRVIYEPNAQIIHYEFASSESSVKTIELQKKHQKIFLARHADFLERKCLAPNSSTLAARNCVNNFRNILFIDDRVPHKSLGSGFPRSANIIEQLSKLDVNLALYPLRIPNDDWNLVYKSVPEEVEVVLNQGTEKLKEFLQSRIGLYDTIIISRVHNMEYFREIVDSKPTLIAGCQIVYDAEALTSLRDIMFMEMNGRILSEKKKGKALQKELALANIANVVVAVSNKEAKHFESVARNKTVILGHQIEACLTINNFENRKNLLFVGALMDKISPNVDSVTWFIDEIFPHIKNAIEEPIALIVIGAVHPALIQKMADKDVSFLGRVEDIQDIYNQARVFIAPTRYAAGIPHKVHEAAAKGIPVVATPLLADQLEWQHGKELMVGCDPEEFAKCCVRLYKEEDLWNTLRKGAYKRIHEECSSATFKGNIEKILNY